MQRITIPRIGVAFAIALGVLGAAFPAFGQGAVERVEVGVTVDGPSPHRVLRERLQATAESIAERLLLGRPLDQLLPLQPRLGETLGSVFERVVTGYAVIGAAVQLGATSTVTVRLRPVGIVMQDVVVMADLRGVHSRLQPLLTGLLQQGAFEEVRVLLVGLPVASLDWAEPVVEARARASVEEAVVGYTAGVKVRPGVAAHVELAIVSSDSRVIRNIGVRFRSGSIPTMLLDQHAPQVASMADPLRGVPVTFAGAHRRALERLINDELLAYPPATQYHIVATAALDIAETTYVNVVADSLLYRGKVEAQLNIGVGAPGPAVVAHLGRLVAPRTEFFVETRLVPNTLSLEGDLGAQFLASPSTLVGVNYAVVGRTVTLRTTMELGRDLSVRGAWNMTQQLFEGALTYRINEFLAGELVGSSRGDMWLRLVSNL